MNQALLSFNAGEVTPYLRHRIDFEKTPGSAELMENFLPMPYGGVIKRPGLLHAADSVATTENSRFFPFMASNGENFLLHFTPDALNIYELDGTLHFSLPFMDGFAWPDPFVWETSIRALQMVQVNDVAFFTHPSCFPLQLSRLPADEWALAFMDFPRAPMLDENLDETKTFTVASNPVAATWADGASYAVGATAFTNCEWQCTAAHTASGTNQPGVGANWRDFWMRKFFQAGDPVTLLSDDRSEIAWVINYYSYVTGYVGYAPFSAPFVEDTDDLYKCLENHTQDATYLGSGFTDHTWRVDDGTAPAGRTWVQIFNWSGGEGTSSNWGEDELCYVDGNIYRCILAHPDDGDVANRPGTGASWATYWSLEEPIPDPVPEIIPINDYLTGTRVSNGGRIFVALSNHTPSADTEPGVGVDWEDEWTELARMVESFSAVTGISPGQYFKLSPERDDQDFQVEITAVAGNNGKFSEAIAVQGAWNFFTYGTWSGTFILQRSVNGGITWDTSRSWQATADRNVADSGIEDQPVLLRLGFISESGTAGSGKQRGLLIPESPYVTGYALMDTYVGPDEMTGFAKTPMLSGNTARWAEGAFNSRDGYPRAIALHERRLVFAGTTARPVSIWLSGSDDLNNFETGPEADDGIYATLALTAASPIRWLASQRRLFIGTAYGEWVVGSETSDQPITPTNFLARQYSGHGSSGLQPLIANDGIFFVERKGTRLRDLGYSNDSQSYASLDLTQLAEHLTRPGISNMAWQQTRNPGLWVVTREGMLLHFAYDKASRIMAWSRHTTAGGIFRDVVVIPSDEGDDQVFFIVHRGATSSIEQFPQNWQDTYEAGTGYHCLDGIEDAPIVSRLRSLPIDAMAQNGTTQAGRKRQHRISVSLFQSSGGFVWNTAESRRQTITPDSATLTTGWIDVIPDTGHLDDLQFNLYHADPRPFILRSAVLKWAQHEP